MEKQIRLTYITTAAFPAPKASSVQVVQMCAAFAAAGALVKLVGQRSTSTTDVFEYYGLSPAFKFETRALPRWPRAHDILQAQAVLAEPGADWICYSRIRDLTAPTLALMRGAKAGVEVHGPPLTLREKVLLKWIARHPRGRLIAISEPLRDFYQRDLGLPTFVAPDAVDVSRFEPQMTREEARAHLGLNEGPWVVYVGGLYEGRGLDQLFHAVSALPAKVLIVGGRSQEEIELWRERARSAGATRVRFEGYQPPPRVPLYLSAADVLVMPYGKRVLSATGEDITHWTSPLKLFEYLAAGRPILATALPALFPPLVPDHNALVAPVEDVAGLRAALERVLNDPQLAMRLATAARQTAQSHTWVERARRILECLN
jgi:glycosyltransferase involved in cell wall biosynthesis